ncbi:hypothetical protein [Catenulispora yoronensis]|uniref:hypothetical protein n=1 Tax=Catenulispora yoronensis TaxID=450799 RepID=UPI0031D8AB76
MTGAPGGRGSGRRIGSGRHRGRFAEHAKPLAAVLLGIGGVLAATAGMVTLLCSDPAGDPSSAVTTTIADPGGDVVGGDTAGGETVGGDTVLTPSPTSPTTPPPPQWQGILQIDTTGLTLATIPPSPDHSGTPDLSTDTWTTATFTADRGAARWTTATAPTPSACEALLQPQNTQQVTAVDGDVFCIRVAHMSYDTGRQYATVKVLAQGHDAAGSPVVRVEATVWPDLG